MQQSIVGREVKRVEKLPSSNPRQRFFSFRRVSRKNSFNYVMFNMRKLTTRQQQNNINCDDSESECNGEIKGAMNKLTAARTNCTAERERDSGLDSIYIIQFAQSATNVEQLQQQNFVHRRVLCGENET